MNEPIRTDSPPRPTRARRFLRQTLITVAWLVTLVILFYAEENWRGARAVSRVKRQLATAGEKIDLKDFIPPPVPDDQNFAMTPFFASLYDFEPGTQKQRDQGAVERFHDFAREFKMERYQAGPKGGGWQLGRRIEVTDPAAALEDLKQYASVLDELKGASRRSRARFNIRYDESNPWAIKLPHLSKLKRLCEALTVRAEVKLALGQPEQALQDIQLGLYLADSTKEEPTLISHLVRVACVQIVMQPIWEGLRTHQWSEPQLAALQTRLQQIDIFASMKFAMHAERAWSNATIERLRDHRIELRAVFSGDSGNDSLERVILEMGPRGWFDQEQCNYNRLFSNMIASAFNFGARRIHPKVVAEKALEMEKTFSGSAVSLVASHGVLARLLLPALANISQKSAFLQTTVDMAELACALERHRLASGQFPDTLDALTPRWVAKLPHDVISGEPLKYRRTQEGRFVLYSVGWNEVDDGGTIATAGKSNALDRAQGDWVWQYPTK